MANEDDVLEDFLAIHMFKRNIIDEWFEKIPSWALLLKEVKTLPKHSVLKIIEITYPKLWYIDIILDIFDKINTSIETTIKVIIENEKDNLMKVQRLSDNKSNILNNLNTQKKENIIDLKRIINNDIDDISVMIGGRFNEVDIIKSNTYIEYKENKTYPFPDSWKKNLFKKLVDLMPQIKEKIEHFKIEQIKDTENPIEYYIKSLKIANYYVYRRRRDPLATSKLTTIQGAAFEEHRKRLWEFFGFEVKGNQKEHEKQYLGGYAIDQIILWNDKLVALEEDKSRSIDKGNTEKAIIGMAKTINHYQDLKSSYWKDTTFKSPDEFLIKKNGKHIMPHIIIHTFAKYGQVEHELDECKDVFKGSIKDKFIYGKTFHYTTLINKSNSALDSANKTWFYKQDDDDDDMQKFFSDKAKIKNIIKDIELIIHIIPPLYLLTDEIPTEVSPRYELPEMASKKYYPKVYWMNQLEKDEKNYEDLIKKQEEDEDEQKENQEEFPVHFHQDHDYEHKQPVIGFFKDKFYTKEDIRLFCAYCNKVLKKTSFPYHEKKSKEHAKNLKKSLEERPPQTPPQIIEDI
tara:strand:+ start:558 stop:2276 length:1719 start_codon:yes stop_codon:yes gene_type:complete